MTTKEFVEKYKKVYESLINDPYTKETDTKTREQVASEEAQQRVKQSMNNEKALSMAAELSSVEKFTSFVTKQEVDLDDIIYGTPSRPQLKRMKKPVELFDLKLEDLDVKEPPSNSSKETIQELRTLQDQTKNVDDDLKKTINRQDEDVVTDFIVYCDKNNLTYDKAFLDQVIKETASYVSHLKYKFNRPRPRQLGELVDIPIIQQEGKASNTPSYPSGHTIQARVVALFLGREHPKHREELLKLAEEIGVNRIRGGFHYTSDHEAGRVTANNLWASLLNRIRSMKKAFGSDPMTELIKDYMESRKEKWGNITKIGNFVTEETLQKDEFSDNIKNEQDHIKKVRELTEEYKKDEKHSIPKQGHLWYDTINQEVYSEQAINFNDLDTRGKISSSRIRPVNYETGELLIYDDYRKNIGVNTYVDGIAQKPKATPKPKTKKKTKKVPTDRTLSSKETKETKKKVVIPAVHKLTSQARKHLLENLGQKAFTRRLNAGKFDDIKNIGDARKHVEDNPIRQTKPKTETTTDEAPTTTETDTTTPTTAETETSTPEPTTDTTTTETGEADTPTTTTATKKPKATPKPKKETAVEEPKTDDPIQDAINELGPRVQELYENSVDEEDRDVHTLERWTNHHLRRKKDADELVNHVISENKKNRNAKAKEEAAAKAQQEKEAETEKAKEEKEKTAKAEVEQKEQDDAEKQRQDTISSHKQRLSDIGASERVEDTFKKPIEDMTQEELNLAESEIDSAEKDFVKQRSIDLHKDRHLPPTKSHEMLSTPKEIKDKDKADLNKIKESLGSDYRNSTKMKQNMTSDAMNYLKLRVKYSDSLDPKSKSYSKEFAEEMNQWQNSLEIISNEGKRLGERSLKRKAAGKLIGRAFRGNWLPEEVTLELGRDVIRLMAKHKKEDGTIDKKALHAELEEKHQSFREREKLSTSAFEASVSDEDSLSGEESVSGQDKPSKEDVKLIGQTRPSPKTGIPQIYVPGKGEGWTNIRTKKKGQLVDEQGLEAKARQKIQAYATKHNIKLPKLKKPKQTEPKGKGKTATERLKNFLEGDGKGSALARVAAAGIGAVAQVARAPEEKKE